jgi:hypothetical protein
MKTQTAYNQYSNHPLRRVLNKKVSTMKTVNGIFDGNRVHLLEKVKGGKKSKVIINFGDELTEEEIVSLFPAYAQNDAFDFWHNIEEDIYQDYLIKKKRKK